ncbi:uncharacterized protein LOC128226486 [Mya arenaria]|uniref:uncharacterized protein LOC128226486 n=1 Tax=Mya arenaria TaxID=6604 RepID=UPI0022E67C97|nr:uncharacterized protein LOC128226486 [Mya arenaria]XP_052792336.1 uncharacterized protein LOC128226486 [Mya arenaria]XP_052792337.1 uncharacterized protein LOC128226486 [Mya arenaria]
MGQSACCQSEEESLPLQRVPCPEGVRHKGVPFPELLHEVERDANRWLSNISHMRKNRPYGPQTVDWFRQECLESERLLHNIRFVPTLMAVPRVESLPHRAKLDQAKKRPPPVSKPEQQQGKKEDKVKKEDNPVQTNLNVELQSRLDNALEHNRRLEESNKRHLAENEDLLLRLSRLAGQRLTDGNPNIADLSDHNRPTKLGEMYSELYDNEWTDAFDGLIRAGYDEFDTIKTLELTLQNIYSFCATKAEQMLTQTEEAVNCLFKEYKMLTEKNKNARGHLTVTKNQSRGITHHLSEKEQEFNLFEMWKPIKPMNPAAENHKSVDSKEGDIQPIRVTDRMVKLRKEMSESMVPVVQKAYIEASWDSGCVDELKTFIMKCIYVCWMMVVQNPQMVFFVPELGTDVNTSMFKTYTRNGKAVDFIVWPAMMLHKKGSVVCKGVLQPK